MTTPQTALPTWDMSVIYPGPDSPEFAAGIATITQAIADLATLFDQHGVGTGAQATPATFDALLARYNAALEGAQTLASYLANLAAADTSDSVALARLSEFRPAQAQLEQLGGRFAAWLGGLDLAALEAQSALARAHHYALQRAQTQAQHLMSPGEEALASQLSASGAAAWKQLYTRLSAQLTITLARDGKAETVPMSVARNLAYDADRALRERAHKAELVAWQGAAMPLAAALNGVKGEVLVLSKRRGWASPLDESLFQSGIDRATLDAMLAAARAALPDMRRYFHAKARALGIARLAWYDLFAPLGASSAQWDYADGTAFILEQFGTYSPELRDFAARAFRERWIDAAPRPGKRGGAYSEPVRSGESRILMNYKPSFTSVIILAHELGHAYHTHTLRQRSALQSQTPETLAETASIFCEAIIRNAALAHARPPEQLMLLDSALQSSAQRVASVLSRFAFEECLFELRQSRELSVDELCALMKQSQRDSYSDALNPAALHPYLWATKIHYYFPTLSFYNYHYLFGSLFSLGLYARYRRDPEAFRASYDDLLSSTGMADAATLAAGFGIDLRAPEFWQASLAMISADIDRFERLVDAEPHHA